MPGTDYAWHELTVKLQQSAAYDSAAQAVLTSVKDVYSKYQTRIEQQHRNVESWMETRIETPTVESRLQLIEGSLQLLVRYPVEIREASLIDQQITGALLDLIARDGSVREAVTAVPAIKAAIKG